MRPVRVEEQVTRALGRGLDQKAVGAVWNWRFKPGAIDGQPATVAVNIEVKFPLQ